MGNNGHNIWGKTYIREWRNHRKMTLEALAHEIGMNKGNLSKVETGKLPYHQGMLEKIADALDCSSSQLIAEDPANPGEVLAAWKRASAEQRAQIRALAEAIVSYDPGPEKPR